jgi:Xaa-Pro dipeptidase
MNISKNNRQSKLEQLVLAEDKANQLFLAIENRCIMKAGTTEHEVNRLIYELAFEMFGIKKYWHKRIVRAGKNTLLPYRHNPENLTIKDHDIVFLDFGPVFEEWEADFGRTYVIGKDERMHQLKNDIERAWNEGKAFYFNNKDTITGRELYDFSTKLAEKYGWKYGNEHAGHLIGNFPHEKIQGEEKENYIHPENLIKMAAKDKNGDERFWIYEIHFIDEALEIGGFYEQLLKI